MRTILELIEEAKALGITLNWSPGSDAATSDTISDILSALATEIRYYVDFQTEGNRIVRCYFTRRNLEIMTAPLAKVKVEVKSGNTTNFSLEGEADKLGWIRLPFPIRDRNEQFTVGIESRIDAMRGVVAMKVNLKEIAGHNSYKLAK